MRYVGPYKITAVEGKGVYHLEHVLTGKITKGIGSHLKLYPSERDELES